MSSLWLTTTRSPSPSPSMSAAQRPQPPVDVTISSAAGDCLTNTGAAGVPVLRQKLMPDSP
jgi:hypothetical protein